MPGQQTCAPPVIVTLPAQLDAAAVEQAAGQITAGFTPGVSVVIADLTAAAWCDRSAIRNLLKAHRKATARGGQGAFRDPPGRPAPPAHRLRRHAPAAGGLPHPPARPDGPVTAAGRQPRGFPAARINPAERST
jgi:anti-anti-sigma regulatory factor